MISDIICQSLRSAELAGSPPGIGVVPMLWPSGGDAQTAAAGVTAVAAPGSPDPSRYEDARDGGSAISLYSTNSSPDVAGAPASVSVATRYAPPLVCDSDACERQSHIVLNPAVRRGDAVL